MTDELREAPQFAVQSESALRAFQRGEEYEQEIRTRYKQWRSDFPKELHAKLDHAYEFGRLAILKFEEGKLDELKVAQRKRERRTSGLPDSTPNP